jgi:hypothetical protein
VKKNTEYHHLNSMAELKKLHIAMFPWLAFGHIIPFLELGKHIARKGHRISFIIINLSDGGLVGPHI